MAGDKPGGAAGGMPGMAGMGGFDFSALQNILNVSNAYRSCNFRFLPIPPARCTAVMFNAVVLCSSPLCRQNQKL